MNSQIDIVKTRIEESIAVKQLVLADANIATQVEKLAEVCLKSLQLGGKVLFAGNGGSFADSQHLSAEFISRFIFDRAPLASIALGTNSSSITAIGNDYGYEQVFARELRALAKPEDIFIPITTSGNSPNIMTALAVAKEMGITTVGLTGESGGKMRSECECICVPSSDTARIQECHILIGHILCELVEENYFRGKA